MALRTALRSKLRRAPDDATTQAQWRAKNKDRAYEGPNSAVAPLVERLFAVTAC